MSDFLVAGEQVEQARYVLKDILASIAAGDEEGVADYLLQLEAVLGANPFVEKTDLAKSGLDEVIYELSLGRNERQVSELMGVSVKTVGKAVERHLKRMQKLPPTTLEIYRQTMLDRLVLARNRVMSLVRGGFPLEAVDRLLKIHDQEIKLLGLEAPKKLAVLYKDADTGAEVPGVVVLEKDILSVPEDQNNGES